MDILNKTVKSRFSEDLIKRAKVIFEKRAKKELSDGEVEICLDRLAKFGDIALRVYLQDKSQ